MLWASTASASPLTVMWDPHTDPDVAGYLVSVGPAPGVYVETHDTGSTNWFTLQEAEPGQQYCFAVAAYLPGPLVGPRSAPVCGYSDRPPVLQPPGDVTGVVGEPAAVHLHGHDPDGRAVWYSATGVPPGILLTPSTGLLAGVPTLAGTYSVRAFVHDGVLSASQSFTWRIDPPPARSSGSGAGETVPEPAPEPAPPDPAPAPDEGAVAGSDAEDPATDPEPGAEPDPTPDPDADPSPQTAAPGAPLTITGVQRGPTPQSAGPLVIVRGTTHPGAGIVSVTWENGHRSGRATGTTSWTARIPLFRGGNTITIAARGADGIVYRQTIAVTRR